MVFEGKYIVASGPLIMDGKKVLLVKDNKDPFFKLPGGTINLGDTLEGACIRQAKNEINADIEIIKPLSPNILYENPKTKEKMTIILINYLAKLKNPNGIKAIPPTQEIKWLGVEDILRGKGNASPNVQQLIKKEFGK